MTIKQRASDDEVTVRAQSRGEGLWILHQIDAVRRLLAWLALVDGSEYLLVQLAIDPTQAFIMEANARERLLSCCTVNQATDTYIRHFSECCFKSLTVNVVHIDQVA